MWPGQAGELPAGQRVVETPALGRDEFAGVAVFAEQPEYIDGAAGPLLTDLPGNGHP